jgi:hypothetical protein
MSFDGPCAIGPSGIIFKVLKDTNFKNNFSSFKRQNFPKKINCEKKLFAQM